MLASYNHTLNHYRYGTMSWSVIGDPADRKVLIKVQAVFTNNHGHIPTNIPVNGTGSHANGFLQNGLDFGDSTSITGHSQIYRVIARDETNNEVTVELVSKVDGQWISGVIKEYAEDGNYTVAWGGSGVSNREGAVNHGGGQQFRAEMTVNIGTGNSSAVAAVPAVIQVKDNTIFTYQLVAIDPNGDSFRFRVGEKNEFYAAANTYSVPTGLVLSEDGLITWDVRDSELSTNVGDRWQMIVMIEDLDSEGNVKSKVPVDFVFLISDKTPATFEDVPEGTVTPIPGEPTDIELEVSDPDYESCDEPAAPAISVLNPPSSDAEIWVTDQTSEGGATTITATFTPTEDMAGQSYVVVFRATTCSGATSEWAVTFYVPGENQAPGDILITRNWIVLPQLFQQIIGAFTVSDIDPGDTHTLSLIGETNTDLFELGGFTGNILWIKDPALALPGSYAITVRAVDSGDLHLDKNFTIYILPDEDGDGIADALPEGAVFRGGTPPLDTLIGNKNYVTTAGTTAFSVQVDEEEAEGTYSGEKLTRFFDGATELMAFANNYSANTIHLANILIKRTINSLVVNMGDELPDGHTKTLYLNDNNFVKLCVKDAPITSIAEISGGCDEEDEIDFTSCIGNDEGVTIEGITCTDEGSRFRVENLAHSGIVGTPPPPPPPPPGGSSGGGGGRRDVTLENIYNTIAELQNTLPQFSGSSSCPTKDLFTDVPEDAWYALYVCILKHAGVVSGYKDAQGNDLRRYIPTNNVTYAELAKMALLASGNQPNANGSPRNPTARGDWSAPYIRTMEGLKIPVYAPSLVVQSPATRGDVIAVMLRLFDVRTTKHSASAYKDLRTSHPHADALLTAVDIGILQGDTSPRGELLYTLRPDEPINRAETAKIFYLLLQYAASQ